MNKKIKELTIQKNSSLEKAMQLIDAKGSGVALVVDNNKRLCGIITDGDIRRAILSGNTLKTPIKNIVNGKPIIAYKDTPSVELFKIMLKNEIRHLPIVDNNMVLLDMATFWELKHISLSSPDITNREIDIIKHVLSTPYLSIGPKIKEFENKVAEYIGTKYAIAVNSGTSALHLCIRSLDIKDGDEVITTPFSFIASANCALFERARPVFVDIDRKTLCIDADKIEEKITPKTKAILPVHVFGHPCQMDKIMRIANKYNLAVIEDACEAIGAEFKRKKVGSFGNVGVFAFYPNKQITTAEGGMIVTNNKKIAELCQSMRNQGRDENENSWLCHKRLGYNYRMSELSAALGVGQIGRIDEILKKRQHIADLYNKRLNKVKGIITPYVAPDVQLSWFVYVIRLGYKKFFGNDRYEVIKKLRAKGIMCSVYFPPIHLQPFYVKMGGFKKGDFKITEEVSQSTIALPFYNNLSEIQIDYICETLKSIIREYL